MQCPENFLEKLDEAITSGVHAVQLREKDLPGKPYLDLAKTVHSITNRNKIPLIINERLDVSKAVPSEGVHLGGNSFSAVMAREFLGNTFFIGKSTHNLDEALAATAEGADYLTFGPIYDTPSKRSYGPPQGIDKLKEICQESPVPIIAIGGITPERVKPVMECGAYGIAVISAVFRSPDITETVRNFTKILSEFY